MLQMTKENVSLSFDAVLESSSELLKKVDEKEEYIDFLNKEICKYISKVIVNETNRKDAKYMSACLKYAAIWSGSGIRQRILQSWCPILREGDCRARCTLIRCPWQP